MAQAATRQYSAEASSTGTFGRVLWNVRDHYFVADGPVSNGCPGIAVGPGEMFLAAVASCAVELIEVLAGRAGIGLRSVRARIEGSLGSGIEHHPGVTVFDSVHLSIELEGVSETEADELVHGFKGL